MEPENVVVAELVRLECLKLATMHGETQVEQITARAAIFFNWVMGHGTGKP